MATRNIVPRADLEGQLGTLTKRWEKFNGRELSENPGINTIPISRADGTLHPGWFDTTAMTTLAPLEILSRYPDGEPREFLIGAAAFEVVRDIHGRVVGIEYGADTYQLSYDDIGNLLRGEWVI